MKFEISTFALKIIGMVAMLIDHVGVVLLPEYKILRVIGRIAFPIFAYLLVEGFLHTHDVKKYMIRLGIFALVSEVPFDFSVYGKPLEMGHQNVFFTLFIGLLMLYLMQQCQDTISSFICALVMVLLGEFLNVDYGGCGILLIFWFYRYREHTVLKNLGIIAINVFLMGYLQEFSILALIPIAFHNGIEGPKMKGFFYGFYPVHFLVLALLRIIL